MTFHLQPHITDRTLPQGPPLSADGGSGHRYYSPTLARWLSRDPIDELGSGQRPRGSESSRHLNGPYRFVGNDPPDAVDPSGLITYGFQVALSLRDQGDFGRSFMNIRYVYDCCRCTSMEFYQDAQSDYRIRVGPLILWWWRDRHPDGHPYTEDFHDTGCHGNLKWGVADMGDRPGFTETWIYRIARITQFFSTYAYCTGGPDAGKFYGFVMWWHEYAREPSYVARGGYDIFNER